MQKKKIEQNICTAIEHMAPDMKQNILLNCDQKKGDALEMPTRKTVKKTMRLAVVAAAAILLFTGSVLGYHQYRSTSVVDTVIGLDVNPSIELKANKQDRILSADALNDDAKVILEGMDLKGADLDVAVNAIVGSMVKNGYLSDISNSILVSVENANTEKGKELQQKVVEEINGILSASSITPSILSQQVVNNDEVKRIAEKYGVSHGKATLIVGLLAKSPTLSEAELAGLTINELNLLAESKKNPIEGVETVGNASDKAYIGEEAAKKIALDDAKISADKAEQIEVDLDIEKGKMVYDVEFISGTMKYEYDIDAKTGEIIKAEKEEIKETSTNPEKPNKPNAEETMISVEKAKEIVLAHVKIAAPALKEFECEWDEEGYYEIHFKVGNLKYEYKIDGLTGEVLKAEKTHENSGKTESVSPKPEQGNANGQNPDKDSVNNGNNSQNENQAGGNSDKNNPGKPAQTISEDKAKEIALHHAGLNRGKVEGLSCKKDGSEYEIEFFTKEAEYCYKIDTKTGDIMDVQVEKKETTSAHSSSEKKIKG